MKGEVEDWVTTEGKVFREGVDFASGRRINAGFDLAVVAVCNRTGREANAPAVGQLCREWHATTTTGARTNEGYIWQ